MSAVLVSFIEQQRERLTESEATTKEKGGGEKIMVAPQSWTSLEIEGQEINFTHKYDEDSAEAEVSFMGTLELDGAMHNVVAELSNDGLVIDSITIQNVETDFVSEWASEGARAFVLWAADTYMQDVQQGIFDAAPLQLAV